ncbi:ATP-binding cassette sub-family A member 1 [Drosophila erecta]|uniref:ABC transporter domain-containing protein n=1 Tax=Drosophila erecta TaxID=7220 RepID=B3NHR3_DROER|nr:ATP-binding cassette sub-family A member 1 [Drosophila erecta]EDV51928.2 uncharacterized protein Dere_GG15784 [Drosophila erecta]
MYSSTGDFPLYKNGFLAIQQTLSQVYIKHKLKEFNKAQENINFPLIKDLPSPPIFNYNKALEFLAELVIFLITFIVVFNLVEFIVDEKELQLKVTLMHLGVGSCLQWVAWYILAFIIFLIGSLAITLFWKLVPPKSEISFLPSTHWSMLLVSLLVAAHCAICFGFLISSLKTTKHYLGLITTFILYATKVPSMFLISVEHSAGLSLLCCFFLLSGQHMLYASILSWERYGEGLQWGNLFEISWPGETVSAGNIILIMLFVSFFTLFLCLYIEQVRPGNYGVARPWHFPCTYCCSTKSFVPYRRLFYRFFGIYRAAPDEERPDPKLIEPDPEGLIPGVQIRGLRKSFGNVEVVKNVSFDMFEGQITVLMGHNGAGKTTLLTMLAGFITPTSGTALINGFDIRQERRKARSCISLCPQQNVLFSGLSVSSHIQLFSRLRGLRGAEVKAEVQLYLMKLNLEIKKKTAAQNLSGGAQRRLCVACCLCGGVKVLICDEPSTGLDPGARRELWRLILEAKEGRTILLTTHQLDDGEVLGDRMVIISDGQLRCIGSLSFLKKLVDANCLLTCEVRKRCDVEQLTSLISRYVGNIQPFSIKGRDICYKLPISKTNSYSPLFRDLERQMNTLGVRGFSISSVSLEEIFMTLGAEDLNTRKMGGAEKRDEDYNDQVDGDQDENVSSCGKQWRAMMTKKILALYDSKVYFLILFLLPIVYLITMLILEPGDSHLGKMTMDITEYGDDKATILVSVPENRSYKEERRLQYIASLIKGEFKLKVISETVNDFVTKAWKSKNGRREITFMPMAIDIADSLGVIGWVGPRHYVHAAPMILNLVYNAIARELMGPKITIEVTSAPFIQKTEKIDTPQGAAFFVIFYVLIVMILFANAIIQEHVSHMKMQQEVSGLRMITYWLSHLTFDLVVFTILALSLLLPLSKYAPWYFLLEVLLATGIACLIFIYFFISTLSASSLGINIILSCGLLLMFLMAFFGQLALKYKILYVIIYLAHLHPIYSCHQCMQKLNHYTTFCGSYQPATNTMASEMNCINPIAMLYPRCVCENPGIYPELLVMLGGAIIFFMLLMFFEYGSCIWYRCVGCCPNRSKSSIEDPKVAREAEKIRAMNADQIRSRALVVDGVSKKYCSGFLAVNNISFALRPRHCLGLLGPNGAGKTSTFKMIVGEHAIGSGNIYIAGYNMKKERNKAMQEIGYCPQYDSFFEFLTGRQMLKIFLLIWGCPSKRLNQRCEQLGDQFGFRKHLDKKISYYSGGTKRKINAAVACGAKSLICLDEPSAGVDPASRRHVWTIINENAQQGKSVLLTSHNMDEINALCSKSVVMVDGRIYAMGSNQHVKNKICKGMLLKLVVNEQPDKMLAMLTKIEDDISKSYPTAELKETYEFSGRLTFLFSEDTRWSQVFEFVEGNRSAWKLADYSISQPSLEDVFEEIAEQRRKKKDGI